MTTKKDLLRQTKDDLAAQIIELEKRVAVETTKTEKDRIEEVVASQSVMQAVENLTADKVAQELAGVSVRLSQQLASVSDELTRETRRLDTVREAVRITLQDLERIHGKDVVASALDVLLLKYRAQEKELATKIQTIRDEWERERLDASEQREREVHDLALEHEREKRDWDFKQEQVRKDDLVKWADKVRVRAIEEDDRKRNLERVWKDREDALHTREAYVKDLEAKIGEFPATLAAAVKTQLDTELGKLHGNYRHQIALLEKDQKTSAQISDAAVANLSKQLLDRDSEVRALREQLAKVDERVQLIATSAIQEAGSAKALSELRGVSASRPDGNGSTPPRRS